MPIRLMSRKFTTTLKVLMVFTFYLTKRCWFGFARSHYVISSSKRPC